MGFSGFGANTAIASGDELVIEQGGNTRKLTADSLVSDIAYRVSLQGVGTTATPTQTLANGVWTRVQFRTENYDDGNVSDIGLAPGIPIRTDGTSQGHWLLYCTAQWAYHANNTTPRRIRMVDGSANLLSAVYQRGTSGSATTYLAVQAIVDMSEHSYVYVEVQQEAGAGETIDLLNAFFYGHRISI